MLEPPKSHRYKSPTSARLGYCDNPMDIAMDNQQERSLAWLAGILDGEGSISVQVYTLPDGRVRFTPFICIVNTDESLLAEAKRIFTEVIGEKGITYVYGHGGATKPCFVLRINGGPGCKAMLQAVMPYLRSSKVKNAEAVLAYIASREQRLIRRDALGRLTRSAYSRYEVALISSIRSHSTAKSSEAICRAPNVLAG
jgi:hypothetical protein